MKEEKPGFLKENIWYVPQIFIISMVRELSFLPNFFLSSARLHRS